MRKNKQDSKGQAATVSTSRLAEAVKTVELAIARLEPEDRDAVLKACLALNANAYRQRVPDPKLS